MNNLDFSELFVNRAEAYAFIESTADPEIKVLLEMAQHQAYRVIFRPSEPSFTDKEYVNRLPTIPFDMLYYIQSVERLLKFKHIIREVLSGNLDAADTWA